MMATTRADFGFPPKKRLTTYGKAGRRYGASNSPGVLRKEDEASTVATVQISSASTSAAEGPSETSKRSTSQQVMSQQPRRGNGRNSTTSNSAVERTSAPSGKTAKENRSEAVVSRAKKRKVGTSPPPDKADAPNVYDIYSPPSSPLLAPSSPKRSTRPIAKKVSSVPLASTRAGATADLPMEIDDGLDTPFSSKTSKSLRGLSIDNASPEKVQSIPFRLTQRKLPQPPAPPKKPVEPTVRRVRASKPAVPTRRGKRLIDALAAQVEDSSEDEQMLSQETAITARSNSPGMVLDSSPPSSQTAQPKARTLQRQISMSRKPGPKFTYSSQQRTMLAEESVVDIAAFADDEEAQRQPAFLSLGSMGATSNLSAFSFVDDEDDTANTGAVTSLHELRQAGANNRFSDEMDDILDRIGTPVAKPSSLRRGALFELAQKMKEANFRRQFRNHGSDGGLFQGLAQERDLIAGFAIVSIFTTLLATSFSQHLISQIQPQGISHLLLLLLDETSDISLIAKDRKRNVSKNGQATLSTIKDAILRLPIWEPASPSLLPPRTLALKTFDLLMRPMAGSGAETELFSPTITHHLFAIISGYANPACWDFPTQHASADFYLALHLVEHYSVNAMQSDVAARWTTEYLPTVADVLGVALQRPVDKFDDLETLTLKLTLNMTNNNHDTPAMFVNKGLLRDLAEAACRTFEVVNKSIMDDAFLSKVLDSLILMLGVKINFCEHYSPAAQDLMEAGDNEASPLNRLIRVFLDYHAIHADVSTTDGRRALMHTLTLGRRTRWRSRVLMSPSAISPFF